MFAKYFCKNCNYVKSKFDVRKADCGYYYDYRCKKCGTIVESIPEMLVRMNNELQEIHTKRNARDLNSWIETESRIKYPNKPDRAEAFRDGIYEFLEKINYNFEKED